jgi:hypothetical protein
LTSTSSRAEFVSVKEGPARETGRGFSFVYDVAMRKIVAIASCLLVLPISTVGATAGSKCPKAGAVKKATSVSYLCVRSGKQLFWRKTEKASGTRPTTTVPSAVSTLAALKIPQTVGVLKTPPPDATPSQGGPWATRLVLRTSSDGVTFTGREVLMDQGGVPNLLATSSGSLYAYFQDWANGNIMSVAVKAPGSATWQYYRTSIAGVNAAPGGANGVDPSAVELSDGRIRLFWMQRLNGNRIYSATSTLGATNGIVFTFDGGFAFDSPLGLYDPTVVQTANGWSMWFSSDNAAGLVYATSTDGLRFSEQPANSVLPIATAFPWSASKVSSTEIRLLASINGPGGADGVIYRSSNGGASFQELGRNVLPAGVGGDAAITYQASTNTWYLMYLERM